MGVLRKLLAVFTARWFWTLLGAVLLSLVVLLFGGLLAIGDRHVLDSETSRLICVLVIAVLWGVSNLWRQERARRSNARLIEALAPPPPPPGPGAAELDELGRRFQTATARLRNDRLGEFGRRRWLYQVPWYVMIGPPGSGKTTALVQSGLRFPLSGGADLRGAGGTRYCDWLFTDQAVLIDTAGRYTSQDSDAPADKAAWEGFLDLLRRHRPRQPLNGVLVALPAPVLTGDRAAAEAHASRIRARLQEIEQRLQLRLPVYLLVTKTDLVAGFAGFFERLEERDREQVWGHTFPGTPGRPDTPDPAAVQAAVDDLVGRLDRRLPRRLAEEDDLARRAEIFGFPAQVAALGNELARFVQRCCGSAGYEHGVWLRGVYLTSGTQTGSPIDRLMDAIAGSLGLPTPPVRPAMGDRSFFLTRLLRDVVFGEASLVGRNPAQERRERLLRGGALAGLAALALLLCAGWGWSYTRNLALQRSFAASLAAAGERLRPFGQTRLTAAEGDDLPVLPALDGLADLHDQMAAAAPWPARLGLSRRGALQDLADAAYHNALAQVLLPRLVLTAEASLRQHIAQPEAVLDGLKVYLMLGHRAPLVPELVTDWFARDAGQRGGAEAEAAMRRHLTALPEALATVTQWPALDSRLIADAQATLERVPLAQRAYQALLAIPELRALPGWRLTDHAGPAATVALVRRSHVPLGQPIPAIFTYDGFHKAVLPLLDSQAQATWNEAWVIGSRSTPQPAAGELERLKADMLSLYYDDMNAHWDALLADVTIAPLSGDLQRTEQVTRALGGPASPLKLFLQAVVHETDLTAPPPSGAPPADLASAASAAADRLTGWLRRTTGLLSHPAQAATPAQPPGAPVAAHFAALKQVVTGADGAPPPVDDATAAFGAFHTVVAQLALAPGAPDTPARQLAAGKALGQALAQAPPALQKIVGAQAAGVSSSSTSAVRQQLTNAWQSDVLPACRDATAGRFPFVPTSPTDASLEDLARLFGKGGLIDGFVTGPLAPYVNTARRPWADTQGIGLDPHALAAFALAKDIGSKLMGIGAAPRAGFTLTLEGLSGGASAVMVDLDGSKQSFDTGPRVPRPFVWPGPNGTGVVRVTFTTPDGVPAEASKVGPWAFFRLAEPVSAGALDQYSATVSAGGYAARFRLQANSTENPFNLSLFARFACPEGL
jgi:type VI secretion system protein ImpL